MIQKTVAYKFNNKIYVGLKNKDNSGNDIVEFTDFKLDGKFKNDRLYISLFEIKEIPELFILEDYPLINIEGNIITTDNLGQETLLGLSNIVLNNFLKKTTYH